MVMQRREQDANEATAKIERDTEGKALREVAQYVIDNTPNASDRLIAERVRDRIAEFEKLGVKFSYTVAHVGQQAPAILQYAVGVTNRHTGERGSVVDVWVNGSDVTGRVGTTIETILHEMTHAVTAAATQLGGMRANAGTQIGRATQDLYAVSNAVIDHVNARIEAAKRGEVELSAIESAIRRRVVNAVTTPDEVLVWALTNREFQDYLESIPYKGGSMWSKFVEAVRGALGLTAKADTALSEVLRVADSLFSADAFLMKRMAWGSGQNLQVLNGDGDQTLTQGAQDADRVPSALRSSPADIARGLAASEKTITPDFVRDMTEDQQATMRKVGLIHTEKTLIGRIREILKDFGKKFIQGMFDQYAPIKELDQNAYMLARMSTASDGGLEAMMLFGTPYLDDNGALDVRVGERAGFFDVMRALLGEHDRFFAWVAGKRAVELKADGKENLLTDEDLSTLADLNAGEMADGSSRVEAYATALKELQDFNKATLDIAEKSGLIDGESRALWESEFYVPFYRVMEEGFSGPSIKSGLVGQYAFKKLKGGTENLNDLFKNTLANWSHLLSASAKNRAALASMKAAQSLGIVHVVEKGTKGAVKVMESGEQRSFVIDDPYLMDAVASLEFAGFGPAMLPFQKMKRLLTMGVTISPSFKVANLIRDTLSSIGTNPIDYNPIKNLAQGWKATNKNSQTYASMLAGGGMFRFGTTLEGERAENAKRLIQSGIKDFQILDTKEKVRSFFSKAWGKYEDIGDRAENVNRAAIYEQLRAKGVSHAEASFVARDMMDFSLQGKWAMVRFLTQVVPFMNARLQGLYKLGRASMQDKRRFAYVAGSLATVSIALMLAQGDDEDWKRRDDWDRDAYWWVKIGGIAFYIPKPFELGAIGTLAERTTEYFISDEMDGARYRRILANMFSSTFAMSPVPQLVKPLLDIYANKDAFTGRAIETMGMERLRKEDRASATTSGIARLVGGLGLPDPGQLLQGSYEALSPVQVDHLIRGYFGSIGTGAGMLTDLAFRPLAGLPELPDRGLQALPVIGRFIRDADSTSSRYVTELYEESRKIEEAHASYRDAVKRGDTSKAAELLREDGEEIRAAKRVARIKQEIGDLNRRAMKIRDNPTMPADQKQQMILRIKRMQEQLAKRV